MMMHATSDHHAAGLFAGGGGGFGMMGVLPFDGMGMMYEQPRPKLTIRMPRVVADQRKKFEEDELFRRLGRESEVKYTGYRDRPLEERRLRFQNGCRDGHAEIAFAATGTNLQLIFGVASGNYAADPRECDFDKEHGKVHLKSRLIMNGVCVLWRGWIDLERLDGLGCLEYDEERAAEEDALLRDQIELYNRCVQDAEDKHRAYRGGGAGGGGGAVQAPRLDHHRHHHHQHGHHAHLGIPGGGSGAEHGLGHRQDAEMDVRLRAY